MAKWSWLVLAVAAIVLAGCRDKDKYKRQGLFDGPRPGDEVEPEVKTFSAEDHHDLGMVYYSGGKFKEAEAQFMMALRERKDYPEAFVGLGYVYQFKALMEIHADKARDAIELHEKAVKFFSKAMQLNPRLVEPLVGLAMVYFDEYQYFTPKKEEYRRRAMQYLAQARAINPKDPVLQANLAFHEGNYALEDKDYPKGHLLFKQVTDCQGVDLMTRVQAHYKLGGCCYMVGDRQGAIDNYRKYLELLPGADDAEIVNSMIADIQAELIGHK